MGVGGGGEGLVLQSYVNDDLQLISTCFMARSKLLLLALEWDN